jgi:hypothetical protein
MGCCNSTEYSSSLDGRHIGIFIRKLAAVALTEKEDSEVFNQEGRQKK